MLSEKMISELLLKCCNVWHNIPKSKSETEPINEFNPFLIMKERYNINCETFHSYLLCNILNPAGTHGDNGKYLDLFLQVLKDSTNDKKNVTTINRLTDIIQWIEENGYDGITCEREFQFIDVLIRGCKKAYDTNSIEVMNNDQNDDWAVIIENKINAAPDQARQIPRYIETCCQFAKTIVVVYLSDKEFPDTNGWSENDKKIVQESLIYLPINVKEKYCFQKWVKLCAESATEGNQSLFYQYADLVRKEHQEMNDEINNENFIQILLKDDNCDYCLLREFFEQATNSFGSCAKKMASLLNEAKENENKLFPDKRLFKIWQKIVLYVDIPIRGVPFAFDIGFGHPLHNHEFGFMFFIRKNNLKEEYVHIMEKLKNWLKEKGFEKIILPECHNEVRYIKRYNTILQYNDLNEKTDEICAFYKELKAKIEDIVPIQSN